MLGEGVGGTYKMWCMDKFGKMVSMFFCIFDTAAYVRDIPNKFV